MQIFVVQRMAETPCSTWGTLRDPSGAPVCKVLERGAHNPAHLRIAAGLYRVTRKPFGASHFDGTFRNLIGESYKGILWLADVPSRANIEIHTANFVEQLEGCLAAGGQIARDGRGVFMIVGGTSRPAFARLYALLSPAIDVGGAQILIHDIENQ